MEMKYNRSLHKRRYKDKDAGTEEVDGGRRSGDKNDYRWGFYCENRRKGDIETEGE